MKTDTLDRCGCGNPAYAPIGNYFVSDSMCKGCYDFTRQQIKQELENDGYLVTCEDCNMVYLEASICCPRCG